MPHVANVHAGQEFSSHMDGYEIKIMFQNTLFGDVTLVDQKTKALLLFFWPCIEGAH
jgi:hypothetical protein